MGVSVYEKKNIFLFLLFFVFRSKGFAIVSAEDSSKEERKEKRKKLNKKKRKNKRENTTKQRRKEKTEARKFDVINVSCCYQPANFQANIKWKKKKKCFCGETFLTDAGT